MNYMSREKKYNAIGFNFTNQRSDNAKYRHCAIHEGTRLVQADDPDLLLCPDCGTTYLIKDTTLDQKIQSTLSPSNNTTRIVTGGKRPIKYYDARGNELPDDDEDIKRDIAKGYKIIAYREDKVDSVQ